MVMALSVSAGPARPRGFLIFKYVVYGLLAINVVLFLIIGEAHESIDSLGWVLLLGSFEFETSSQDENYGSHAEKYVVLALQISGYALALYGTWSYWQAQEWPDFINAFTWLCVCATLAYDVYAPGGYGGLEWRIRNSVKAALYATLIGVALYWAYDGLIVEPTAHSLLEVYDAFLWIVCFGVIELNVFDNEAEDDTGGALNSTG